MEASRRRPRHASRPFPFLPFSSPAPPPGKVSIRFESRAGGQPLGGHGRHGKSVSWKTASPGRVAVVAIWPPPPFRAAPVEGAWEELYRNEPERQAQSAKFLNFFCRKSGNPHRERVRGWHFFAGGTEKRLPVSAGPCKWVQLRRGSAPPKLRRYGAGSHLRRGAAVRCWKRGVTDMALGAAGQATTQAPQPMQRAGFM